MLPNTHSSAPTEPHTRPIHISSRLLINIQPPLRSESFGIGAKNCFRARDIPIGDCNIGAGWDESIADGDAAQGRGRDGSFVDVRIHGEASGEIFRSVSGEKSANWNHVHTVFLEVEHPSKAVSQRQRIVLERRGPNQLPGFLVPVSGKLPDC